MKTLLLAMTMSMTPMLVLADPPGEDIHRPSAATEGRWYTQIDAGINFTFLNGNPAFRNLEPGESPTDLFKSANGLGSLAGITLGYQATDHFALSFSAAYDARHTARHATIADTCHLMDFETGEMATTLTDIRKDYSVDVNYVSFSLLGNFRFDNLYVFAGPTASTPLGQRVTETNRILDEASDCTYLFNTENASKVISAELDVAGNVEPRFSLKVGAGYEFKVNRQISIVPQLAYDIGFQDLLKDDEVLVSLTPEGANAGGVIVNRGMRINSLQATLGLRINL